MAYNYSRSLNTFVVVGHARTRMGTILHQFLFVGLEADNQAHLNSKLHARNYLYVTYIYIVTNDTANLHYKKQTFSNITVAIFIVQDNNNNNKYSLSLLTNRAGTN